MGVVELALRQVHSLNWFIVPSEPNRPANPATTVYGMLLGLLVAAVVCGRFWTLSPGQETVRFATLFVAAAAACAGLARRLPLQNVLLAAMLVALAESAAQVLGFPFSGDFPWQPINGSEQPLFSWGSVLLWILAVLNARAMARLLLPWLGLLQTAGFWVLGLASILAVADLHLWGKTVLSAEWSSRLRLPYALGTEGVLALVCNVAITPAILDKRPSLQSADLQPLLLWTVLSLAALFC